MGKDSISVEKNVVDKYVRKSNLLIEHKGAMTSLEQHLFAIVVSMVGKYDQDFKKYEISIRNLADIMGKKDRGFYLRVHSAAEELMHRIIRIEDDKGLTSVPLFNYVHSPKGQGYIVLDFHPLLKPYLLELQETYTLYQLKYVLRLNNKYAIRIYELLQQYYSIGHRTFDIETLKELLGLKGKYKAFKDFNRRILKRATEEINAVTDIEVKIIPQKLGRKTKYVKFVILPKDIIVEGESFNLPEINRIEQDSEIAPMHLSSEEIHVLHELAKVKVQGTNLPPCKYINMNYLKMISSEGIEDPYNWLKKALEEDYSGMLVFLKDGYKLATDTKEKKKVSLKNPKNRFHNFEQKYQELSNEDFEKFMNNKKK